MKKQVAVRNLRLCTKDCLCLYVCPTGATDTENSVIDTEKCLGCGVCAGACPSGAISMVPVEYPPQQKKAERVLGCSYPLANHKARQEKLAGQQAEAAKANLDRKEAADDGTSQKERNRNDAIYRLMTAVAKSVRLVNEDLLRESGYMLPQSGNVHKLLKEWAENPPSDDFPVQAAQKLLKLLPDHERENMEKNRNKKKYRCLACGHVFETENEEPVCPVCGAAGINLEQVQ